MGRCRCRLAPLMYIEFSAELAEPGGLIVGPEVGPTETQSEIIRLVEQWERAGNNPAALDLIGKTDKEMLNYLYELMAEQPEGFAYEQGILFDRAGILKKATRNADYITNDAAMLRAKEMNPSISRALHELDIAPAGVEPSVSRLTSLRFLPPEDVWGTYRASITQVEVREEFWDALARYLSEGKKFKAAELEELKRGLKTLMHEYIHSLTPKMAYTYESAMIEEGLTEYIAWNNIDGFIAKLGLDTINKKFIETAIKYKSYTAQVEGMDSILGYVSHSQKIKMNLAVKMHQFSDQADRAQFFLDAMCKAHNIKIRADQAQLFKEWFGSWESADDIATFMKGMFGL